MALLTAALWPASKCHSFGFLLLHRTLGLHSFKSATDSHQAILHLLFSLLSLLLGGEDGERWMLQNIVDLPPEPYQEGYSVQPAVEGSVLKGNKSQTILISRLILSDFYRQQLAFWNSEAHLQLFSQTPMGDFGVYFGRWEGENRVMWAVMCCLLME